MKVYLVGGAVRDQLLGLPIKEKDWVVVGATPSQMQQLGFRPVGKDFPVFLHPNTHEEYALARTERKHGRGYKGFTFYYDINLSLEDDLARRDLTINAMAMDAEGTLIDPYGGYQDLQNRIMRHVSPAFIEDPLRVLRVARLMAQLAPFGFRIHAETQQLLKAIVASGELHALTPERVWKEFERALGAADPSAFIAALRACGALSDLFVELSTIHDLETNLLQFVAHSAGCTEFFSHKNKILHGSEFEQPALLRFAFLMYLLSLSLEVSSKNKVVRVFCQTWRLPKAYREFSELVVNHLPKIPNLPATAAEIIRFFEQTDAFRRIQRFVQFLTVSCGCTLLSAAPIAEPAPLKESKESVLLDALIELKQIDLKQHIDFQQVTDLSKAVSGYRCDVLEKWLKSNKN